MTVSFFSVMKCNVLIPEGGTYNIIICGCLRNKKDAEACKLLDNIVDCGFLEDAFTTSLFITTFTFIGST